MNLPTHSIVLAACLASACSYALAADPDPATAAANAKKAQADAEAAAWASEEAMYKAQTAAAKARFGPLADVSTAGTTDVGEGAGTLEAALLSADATRSAASKIVKSLVTNKHLVADGAAATTTAPPRILLVPDSERLNFDAYNAFQAQATQLRDELNRAAAPLKGTGEPVRASTSTSAFTALAMVGNLFRSDYKVSDVKVTPSDLLLVKAIAEAAKEAKVRNALYIPALYPAPVNNQSNPAYRLLADLRASEIVARDTLTTYKQLSKSQQKANAARIGKLEAALKRYDEFSTKISTGDDKGNVPLAVVARQAEAAQVLLDGGRLLILKADATGGSAYAKKNFWTFFGEMPFSVSAGAVVSYALLGGTDGQVLDSGVVGWSRPFMKVKAVSRRYEGGYNP